MKTLFFLILISFTLNTNANNITFKSHQAEDLYNVVKNVSQYAFKCDTSDFQTAYMDVNCRRFMTFMRKRSAYHVFNTVTQLLDAGHYSKSAAHKITMFSDRIIHTKIKLQLLDS